MTETEWSEYKEWLQQDDWEIVVGNRSARRLKKQEEEKQQETKRKEARRQEETRRKEVRRQEEKKREEARRQEEKKRKEARRQEEKKRDAQKAKKQLPIEAFMKSKKQHRRRNRKPALSHTARISYFSYEDDVDYNPVFDNYRLDVEAPTGVLCGDVLEKMEQIYVWWMDRGVDPLVLTGIE